MSHCSSRFIVLILRFFVYHGMILGNSQHQPLKFAWLFRTTSSSLIPSDEERVKYGGYYNLSSIFCLSSHCSPAMLLQAQRARVALAVILFV